MKLKDKQLQRVSWGFMTAVYRWVGTVKESVSCFRSFYFSNNWEMLNTEQIKMPQSKLQNTGYQPVEALFSFIASCCCAVSHRLQLRPRQISVYKKVNRNGSFNSDISIHGFGTLAHKPGSAERGRQGEGTRWGSCGGKSRFTFLFTKAHW